MKRKGKYNNLSLKDIDPLDFISLTELWIKQNIMIFSNNFVLGIP